MKNTRRTFILGFKILAVSMSIYCGRVSDVAREISISKIACSTGRNFIRKADLP